MKAYFYTPQDVGLEKFPPGLMRLEGFERTENPASADVFCLPACMYHFSEEVLLNLKYLAGNEEKHFLWDLIEDFRLFGKVGWNLIRCACTKQMVADDPRTIAWPWPVEPLPLWRVQQLGSHVAVFDPEFGFDVSFYGWTTPLNLTDQACNSVTKTPRLSSLIWRNKFFFGHKKETDLDFARLRAGFVTSLWQSRLALVPASLGGVVRYRLYEQMSMGRGLPVHICDNAVMPWASQIGWEDIVVTIPEADVDNTGPLLVEWLSGQTDGTIKAKALYAQVMFNEGLHRDKWDALFGIAVRERLEGKI